jgi:hypothetical protein
LSQVQDEKVPAEIVQDKVAEIEKRIEEQRKNKPKPLNIYQVPDEKYDYSSNKPGSAMKGSRERRPPTPPNKSNKMVPVKQRQISSSQDGFKQAKNMFGLDDYLYDDDTKPEWTVKAEPFTFEGKRLFVYKSQDLKKAGAASHIQLEANLAKAAGHSAYKRDVGYRGSIPIISAGSKYMRLVRGEPEVLYKSPTMSKKPLPKLGEKWEYPPNKKRVTIIAPFDAPERETASALYAKSPKSSKSKTPLQFRPEERAKSQEQGERIAKSKEVFIEPVVVKPKEEEPQPSTSKKQEGPAKPEIPGVDPVMSSILETMGCPRKYQRTMKAVFSEVAKDIAESKQSVEIKAFLKNRYIEWPDNVMEWRAQLSRDGTIDRLKQKGLL